MFADVSWRTEEASAVDVEAVELGDPMIRFRSAELVTFYYFGSTS
jgi:hypothetical protein